MGSPEVTRVAIAIIHDRGRFLVGRRSSAQVLAGKYEFPGGKAVDGETMEACAVRECHEETGLLIDVQRRLNVTRHRYPHGEVELHFYLCSCRPGNGEAEVQPPFEWVEQQTLDALDFPEANRAVLEMLQHALED